MEVSDGGTTDATAIQLTKSGIPSVVISVPTRYLHSGVEVASLNDLEEAVRLVTKALEELSLLKL
jgi:endoglucanase